jgi:hypothetical protein
VIQCPALADCRRINSLTPVVDFAGKIVLAYEVVIEKYCRGCFQHSFTAT